MLRDILQKIWDDTCEFYSNPFVTFIVVPLQGNLVIWWVDKYIWPGFMFKLWMTVLTVVVAVFCVVAVGFLLLLLLAPLTGPFRE